MERLIGMKRSLLLMAIIGVGTLGADLPATQPAAQPVQPAATAQPNDSQPSGRSSRGSGRTRGSRGSDSLTTDSGSDSIGILRTRSIFIKGNQSPGPYVPRPTISNDRPRPPMPAIPGPESSLVFNGVIMVSQQANALIENIKSNDVSLVQVGTSVAVGRVSGITFDDLEYEARGNVSHISIGEALDGSTPSMSVYTPPPPVAPPTSQPVGATATAAVGTPPSAPDAGGPGTAVSTPAAIPAGSSPDDILARLKAKRNQELGIK